MNINEKQSRRRFFKSSVNKSFAIGSGLSVTAAMLHSMTTQAAPGAITETFQHASTEKDFRMGVIGPAELSLAASKIAAEKSTNANTKEFAGFELEEAIAVTTVLKDLGTPVPPMEPKAKATLDKIKSANAGADFDKAYISAQLENHEFLRDLAQDYLKNSMGKTTPAESQTRHLATLALAVFKEHVAITTRIKKELGA